MAVKRYLEGGVDIESKDNIECTALMKAVFNKRTVVVDYLLRNGANAEVKSMFGENLLQIAMKNYDTDIFQRILDRNVDFNDASPAGWTPLMSAILYREREAAIKLLKRGCAINAQNEDGDTALTLAKMPELVKLLLEYGADMTIKNKKGQTAMDIAVDDSEEEIAAILEQQALLSKIQSSDITQGLSF